MGCMEQHAPVDWSDFPPQSCVVLQQDVLHDVRIAACDCCVQAASATNDREIADMDARDNEHTYGVCATDYEEQKQANQGVPACNEDVLTSDREEVQSSNGAVHFFDD